MKKITLNFTESDIEEMTSASNIDETVKVFKWLIDNVEITITVGQDD